MSLVFGLRNRERVDVVAAAGKQADDAGEHAGLVVDQYAQRAALDALAERGGGIMGGRRTDAHRFLPQRLRRAKAQSRPRPPLSARSIHSMACASRSRALRSGPA